MELQKYASRDIGRHALTGLGVYTETRGDNTAPRKSLQSITVFVYSYLKLTPHSRF